MTTNRMFTISTRTWPYLIKR